MGWLCCVLSYVMFKWVFLCMGFYAMLIKSETRSLRSMKCVIHVFFCNGFNRVLYILFACLGFCMFTWSNSHSINLVFIRFKSSCDNRLQLCFLLLCIIIEQLNYYSQFLNFWPTFWFCILYHLSTMIGNSCLPTDKTTEEKTQSKSNKCGPTWEQIYFLLASNPAIQTIMIKGVHKHHCALHRNNMLRSRIDKVSQNYSHICISNKSQIHSNTNLKPPAPW